MRYRRVPKIGLSKAQLTASAPRGVTRVARGVAESWVGSDRVELLALSDPIYHRHDMIFEACPLDEWLEKNPVVQSADSSAVADASHEAQSISDLDAIVSFECYDPIWDWPTELHSCRMIGMFHDAIPFRIDEKDDPSRYYRAAGKMASRAHLIFCDSEASHRDLTTFFPGTAQKSCVLYLGHDRERFLPEPGADGDQQISRPPGSPGRTIAMIGALEPRKNQSGVLRSCRYLDSLTDSDRVRLLLIGCRPEHSPYRFLEEQARQSVEIVYTGYLSDQDLARTLRQCDLFLFPSLWEGFGIPILEAMTAGVVVVTSNLSSMPEVGGKFAFYCDPHDPRSIAHTVKNALNLDRGDRAGLIGSAREWASAFTWERMTRRLQERVLSTLDGPPRGSEPGEVQPHDRFDRFKHRVRTDLDVCLARDFTEGS
jgi:glycosyltransferase involved in cell wall biosynthesis